MYLHIINEQIIQYESIPQSITLTNGMTRTSLHELSINQQEALGLFYYETIIPEYNPLFQQWNNEYIFDSNLRTATRVIVNRPLETIKSDMITQLLSNRETIQASGYICSNTIKLQVDEFSLNRWTQLMTGLIAFQPANVAIRDYNNVVHTVTLAAANQMLAEIFIWGQTFLSETWAMKDAITVATIEQLIAMEG